MAVYYHYCEVPALFSILREKKLWLSGANNLNDEAEVGWALGKIRAHLGRLRGRHRAEDFEVLGQGLERGQVVPFVCAMASDGDLLSQWRAYADDGYGVAIGFNSACLPLRERDEGLGFYPVVYEPQEQDRLIAEALSAGLAQLDSLDSGSAGHRRAAAGLVRRLQTYAVTFKNPAFAEEREWRLVHLAVLARGGDLNLRAGPAPLKQRSSRRRIYTYCEFGFDGGQAPLCELVLGPKCEIERFDLDVLLRAAGLESVPLRRSSATYR